MSSTLAGKVCVVTGATRGIGKGIAIQLAKKGAKVYITGRTLDPSTDEYGGSLKETAEEIRAFGGNCVIFHCDHTNDNDVEQLFDQVILENDGQLDIFVNNAYSAVRAIGEYMGVKFWDQPVSMWDLTNDAGLRNQYRCAVYAARLMVPRQRGLIVNVSSSGGLKYTFNCAYGIGKSGVDRMAADCGLELKPENVAFVSLWPGPVGTETVLAILKKRMEDSHNDPDDKEYEINKFKYELFAGAETPEFSGQCIAALAVDPNIMLKSGKILMTSELGLEYKLTDKEGHAPVHLRQVNNLLYQAGYQSMAKWIPDWMKLPKWLMAMSAKTFY